MRTTPALKPVHRSHTWAVIVALAARASQPRQTQSACRSTRRSLRRARRRHHRRLAPRRCGGAQHRGRAPPSTLTPSALGSRPDEGGVVAVAASVVPVEAVVPVGHPDGARGGQPGGDRVPDVVDPALSIGLAPFDTLDLHLQVIPDARRAPPAVLAELDGRHTRRQPLGREAPEYPEDAAGVTGEDLFQRAALPVARPLVEVSADGPVSLAHRAGGVDDERGMGAAEVEPPILTSLDAEDQGYVAVTLGRSRRCAASRVARPQETGTQNLAVAVLEVLAFDPPGLCHGSRQPPKCRRVPRLSLQGRARVNDKPFHRASIAG